ncbi:60Kd inner membrane protein-domain-containing protein [Kickxella alabastrina]|uniref:60Kd inner membrane protein-domain-containing protein n=1 Tax=Kickxella alabastrina TaxID=61397 RepID=UPI0022200836|nr:60Kd inner membrane protein-domain-containing protein [Kickxella alabastrina]KAI7824025.1 60Kd inner membrane protein-domain-containing protein [Kickxella alabastrina]
MPSGDQIIKLGGSEDSSPFLFQLVQALLEKLHGGALYTSDPLAAAAALSAASQATTHELALSALSSGSTPWWLVIGGTAVALRLLLTLPLYVRQQRAVGAAQRVGVVAASWRHALGASVRLEMAGAGDEEEEVRKRVDRRVRAKYHELMLREGCHPAEALLLPVMQLPLWVTMTCAVRHLAGRPVWLVDAPAAQPAWGMSWEGLWWFGDLTAPDAYMVLPVVAGLLQLANVVLARRAVKSVAASSSGGGGSGQEGVYKKLVRVAVGFSYITPLAVVGLGIYQPAAIVYYWTVSAGFSLAQTVVFRSDRVRKVFGMPPLPPLAQQSAIAPSPSSSSKGL